MQHARLPDERRPAADSIFCFCAGAGINLEMLLQGGLAGILLGVLTTFIGGFLTFVPIVWSAEVVSLARHPARPVTRWRPLAIAQADPSLASVAAAAAPLIAASVITTAILTPILTSWVAKSRCVSFRRKRTHENDRDCR
jgi:2-keto-3-deoxygluconate permease